MANIPPPSNLRFSMASDAVAAPVALSLRMLNAAIHLWGFRTLDFTEGGLYYIRRS